MFSYVTPQNMFRYVSYELKLCNGQEYKIYETR